MIVVDTNVLVALYCGGKIGPWAESAYWRDLEWAAPPLWRSEMRNALLGFVRRGLISLADAADYMRDAEELMSPRETPVKSDRVLALAAASGCTAYDCEFVAAAQELDVSLVTMDRQLLLQFPRVAVSLETFAGG